MSRYKTTSAVVVLAGLLTAAPAITAAAERQTDGKTTQPGPAFQAAPIAPATPQRPQQPKPDYAISLASQQEHSDTTISWRFRIENKGAAAPSAAIGTKLVISVARSFTGEVCSSGQAGDWEKLAAQPVFKALKPGESVLVPLFGPYSMPKKYAGKGCKFRAEIKGLDDADFSNNTMHMYGKKKALPDLVIVGGGPGGSLRVKNTGAGRAEASKFHFQCHTSGDPKKSCGLPGEKNKSQLILDIPVPALNPGQSVEVMNATPISASWQAIADSANEVGESNELNNLYPPL